MIDVARSRVPQRCSATQFLAGIELFNFSSVNTEQQPCACITQSRRKEIGCPPKLSILFTYGVLAPPAQVFEA
jgi:hypothetical protein